MIVSIWVKTLIPNTTTRESGTVFYNCFYSAYFVSVSKNATTEWILQEDVTSPGSLPVVPSLAAFEGRMIDFDLQNKRFSTMNTYLPEISIYTGLISNISIKSYSSTRFDAAWTQLIVSCAAFLIAIILWRRFKIVSKKIQGDRVHESQGVLSEDLGVFFFGAALILWAMTALLFLYGSQSSQNGSVITMLSISNDYLFAMSFPFFRHGLPIFNRNREYYVLVFTGLFFIALILSSLDISIMPFRLGNYAEAFFTAVVFGTLGYLLNESFTQRGTPLTGLVAIFCSLVAIFCQMATINSGLQYYLGKWGNTLYLSSFILIVVLYITLIYSWYAEEREIQIIIEKDLKQLYKELEEIKNNPAREIEVTSDLIAMGRIRKPIHILKEKYAGEEKFKEELTLLESRLTQLKTEKRQDVRDSKELNRDFNKLKNDLLSTVSNFLNNN